MTEPICADVVTRRPAGVRWRQRTAAFMLVGDREAFGAYLRDVIGLQPGAAPSA
ncbi:MAG TPA: hypothetical protein VIY52_04625 [Streptosporangiaceae bacterium]